MAQLHTGNVSKTGVRWDDSTQSPYFNYISHDNTTVHQQWFETPESLGLKYAAAKRLQVQGVGFYSTPMLDPHGNKTEGLPRNPDGPLQTKAMWAAVRASFLVG